MLRLAWTSAADSRRPFATVKSGQLRQRVRAAAGDAGLLRESTHRVPHRGVYPRPAQIDRRTRQINRVQPATDPITGLHHNALNPAMGKGVRDCQSGNPRTDHHHTLDRLRRPHRNIRSPVVETLSNQPGYPRVREVPHAVAATSSAISASAATSGAPAGRRPMASPAKAVMAAVITTTIQARSNAATPVDACPPSTATKVATPKAEPSWRAVASTAAPDASSARGAASAQANREGWMSALATPHSSMLGSTTAA